MSPLIGDEDPLCDFYSLLHQDVVIIGRIYVCGKCVIFYSNILGYITQFCINWNDVTNITKEYGPLNIPNALKIHTAEESLYFSSITYRDARFADLVRVWCASTGRNYSEFLKLNSMTDLEWEASEKKNSSLSSPTLELSTSSTANRTESASFDESSYPDNNLLLFPRDRDTKSEPDDFSIKSSDDIETPVDNTANPELNCGDFLASMCLHDSTWPYPPDQLFFLMFDNESSVVKDYLIKMKIEGYTGEEFKKIDKFRMERVVNYSVSSPLVGKVETVSTQILTQNSSKTHCHLQVTNKANLSFMSDMCNVNLCYCIKGLSASTSSLKICVSMEFIKKVFLVENKLRRNILSSTEEFVNSLLSLLEEYTRVHVTTSCDTVAALGAPFSENSKESVREDEIATSRHKITPSSVDLSQQPNFTGKGSQRRIKDGSCSLCSKSSSSFSISLSGWIFLLLLLILLFIWIMNTLAKFSLTIAALTEQIGLLSNTLKEVNQVHRGAPSTSHSCGPISMPLQVP